MFFAILLHFFWLVIIWADDRGYSLSLPTIAYVNNCPRSKQEWIARAQLKRCDTISQECTDSMNDFVYHCLLNEWGNATLEVCAPKRNVIGNCPEFNSGGGKIQNSIVPCDLCPQAYPSTEAYKYPECYDKVLKHTSNEVEKNRSTKQNLFEHGSSTVSEITLALVLLQFIVMSIMVAVLVKLYQDRLKKHVSEGDSRSLLEEYTAKTKPKSDIDDEEDKSKYRYDNNGRDEHLIQFNDSDTQEKGTNRGNETQNVETGKDNSNLIPLGVSRPDLKTCTNDKNDFVKHDKEDKEKK